MHTSPTYVFRCLCAVAWLMVEQARNLKIVMCKIYSERPARYHRQQNPRYICILIVHGERLALYGLQKNVSAKDVCCDAPALQISQAFPYSKPPRVGIGYLLQDIDRSD